MSKIRVFAQDSGRAPTSELQSAWEALQGDIGKIDPVTKKPLPTEDEVTVIDNETGNMFMMFLKPDGTGMMLQQVIITMTRTPFTTVPNTPDGEIDWQGVLNAMGVGPKGYTVQPYGPGAAAPTMTASTSSVYQRALHKLLSGYSAKDAYNRQHRVEQ